MSVIENAVYLIRNNKHTGYALNIFGVNGNLSNGTNVTLYSADSSDKHQHWRVVKQSSDKYRLYSAAVVSGSGSSSIRFCLDRYLLSPKNNADVYEATFSDNPNQNVTLKCFDSISNLYQIKLDDGKLLTASSKAANGSGNVSSNNIAGNVYWRDPYPTSDPDYGCQFWTFELIESPAYYGTNFILNSTAVGTVLASFDSTVAQSSNASTGYRANANPFSPSLNSNNGFKHWCTWYAWGRMMERTGKVLRTKGDAKLWYQNCQEINDVTKLSPSAPPQVGVAVFSNPGEGHVVFVEGFDSSTQTVYFTEANSIASDGVLREKKLGQFKKLWGSTLEGYLI